VCHIICVFGSGGGLLAGELEARKRPEERK
jgi:hypothetical protein